MRVIILIIGLFLLSFYSKAFLDSKQIDSVRIVVRNMPNDTTKVVELAKLARKYSSHQMDTALNLIKDATNLSKQLKYFYGNAYCKYINGILHIYLGEYDMAISYSEQSLKSFKQINDKRGIAKSMNSLGIIYKRRSNYEKSLNYLQQSLNILENLNDSSLIASILKNLSLLYQNLGNFNKASEFLLRNIKILKELNDFKKLTKSYMSLGNIYVRKGKYTEALFYYKKSLALTKSTRSKSLLLNNIADAYESLGRYDDAFVYYKEALKIKKALKNKEALINSYRGLGNILIIKGKFNEGEKYLLKGLALAKALGNLSRIQKTLSCLQSAYEQKGLYKKSLYYMKMHNIIQDSIYNKTYAEKIATLEKKYETEKQKQQIANLEKDYRIQHLEYVKQQNQVEQQKFQRNLLIVLVGLIIGILFLLARENIKRRQKNKLLLNQRRIIIEQQTEIIEQNKELAQTNETKDKLFQIIAHDLRSPLISIDSLSQLIPFWIEEKDYDSLQKLAKTMELSVSNVLTLIDNLLNWALNQQGNFPYHPENFDIISSIKEVLRVYTSIAKMKNIEINLDSGTETFVFADKNMFLAVVRNLLNNAIKFTPEDGNITIGVDCKDTYAEVWVKDSGIGIEKEQKDKLFQLIGKESKGTKGEIGKGLGLFFCKEFVTMNKGDVYVDSAPQKGTKVTFSIPLYELEDN